MSIQPNIDLRLAEPGDAPLLGVAALAAGGGIYEHLLAKAAGGLDAATVLASAIAAGTDGLSWRHSVIAAAETSDLGAAIAYPSPISACIQVLPGPRRQKPWMTSSPCSTQSLIQKHITCMPSGQQSPRVARALAHCY